MENCVDPVQMPTSTYVNTFVFQMNGYKVKLDSIKLFLASQAIIRTNGLMQQLPLISLHGGTFLSFYHLDHHLSFDKLEKLSRYLKKVILFGIERISYSDVHY